MSNNYEFASKNYVMSEEIKLKHEPSIKFMNADNIVIGTLTMKEDKITFTGNVDETAEMFFDKLLSVYKSKKISVKDIPELTVNVVEDNVSYNGGGIVTTSDPYVDYDVVTEEYLVDLDEETWCSIFGSNRKKWARILGSINDYIEA